MKLLQLVATANVVRGDGKCFTASHLKMFADESPDMYQYNEAQQELWLKKPEEKKNAHIS
jgi:hypothetical protein